MCPVPGCLLTEVHCIHFTTAWINNINNELMIEVFYWMDGVLSLFSISVDQTEIFLTQSLIPRVYVCWFRKIIFILMQLTIIGARKQIRSFSLEMTLISLSVCRLCGQVGGQSQKYGHEANRWPLTASIITGILHVIAQRRNKHEVALCSGRCC